MTEDNVCGDDVIKSPAPNKSKISKSTWLKIQSDYERMSYLTLEDLGKPYGLSNESICNKAKREGWKQRQIALRDKVLEKVSEIAQSKLISQVDSYLDKSLKRAEKYERMIDASQEFNGSKTAEGLPLLSPDDLDTYSRTEMRIAELSRIALKIVDTKNSTVDINLSVATNFTEAVKKLREVAASEALPELSDAEIERLKDCKIEGEEGPIG